ncbi:MAG: TIGR02710 family CRISPR-associated protein, partial [Actinobacteria bacterium]|nr:TIGR02710 family CRISPR-associated protein [Actinomycetota bacterium]
MVNKKALIISIGVGENTEHGIKFSIDTLHPNKVIFVTTSEGKNTLKRIKDDLKKLKISKEILELDSGEKDDIEIVYEKVTSAIIKLKQEGYCSGNIFIDFTFGTKPMSAGIVSAGIAQRVEQLCYVSGSHRDQKTGKVISGYERYKTLKPNKIFSDYMFSHVKRLFNIYAFEEARIILLYIDEVFFDKHEDEKSFYNALIQAYDFWDKFDYTNAFKKFKEAENKKVTWIIDDESYNLNYKFIETLKKKLSSEGKYTKEQIIDIYSNALRRCEEGKFDDA